MDGLQDEIDYSSRPTELIIFLYSRIIIIFYYLKATIIITLKNYTNAASFHILIKI